MTGETGILDSPVKKPPADRPDREVMSPKSVAEIFAKVFPCECQREPTGNDGEPDLKSLVV